MPSDLLAATGTVVDRAPARRADEPGSRPAGAAAQRSRAGHRARVHAAGPARRSRSPAPRGSRARRTRRRSRRCSVTPPRRTAGSPRPPRSSSRVCRVRAGGRDRRRSRDRVADAVRRRARAVGRLPAPGADHVRPHGPLRHRRRSPLGAHARPARGRRRRARARRCRRSPTKPRENATVTVPLSFPAVTGS